MYLLSVYSLCGKMGTSGEKRQSSSPGGVYNLVGEENKITTQNITRMSQCL